MERSLRWLLAGGVAILVLAVGMLVNLWVTGGAPGGQYRGAPGMMQGPWGDQQAAGPMAAMHMGMRGSMHGGGGAEQLPEAPTRPDGLQVEAVLSLQEWRIEPGELAFAPGTQLVLTVRNDGIYPHNFAIPDLGVRLVNLAPGGSRVVRVNLDQPGDFLFLCDIPGHEQLGQRGRLAVSR